MCPSTPAPSIFLNIHILAPERRCEVRCNMSFQFPYVLLMFGLARPSTLRAPPVSREGVQYIIVKVLQRDGWQTSDVRARAACAHGCPAGGGGRTTLAGQVHGRSTCGESKRSQTKLLFNAHRTLALEPACAPLQIFVLVHELAPAPAFRFVTFSRRHTTPSCSSFVRPRARARARKRGPSAFY